MQLDRSCVCRLSLVQVTRSAAGLDLFLTRVPRAHHRYRDASRQSGAHTTWQGNRQVNDSRQQGHNQAAGDME
jgi:hypothetical protein